MKDIFSENALDSQATSNPNLEDFNRRVYELGLDMNDESINVQRLLSDYIEGRKPDTNRLTLG